MNAENTHRSIPIKQAMPLGRVRKMMVQSMDESVRRAALSQVTREMDLSAVLAARAAAGEQRHSLNTYIMAAVAQTLPNHPLLNAELVDNNIVVFDAVNLGMAVAVGDGLVVAVVRDADKLSLQDLATAIGDLDCDGTPITYTLTMAAPGGNASGQITEPPRLSVSMCRLSVYVLWMPHFWCGVMKFSAISGLPLGILPSTSCSAFRCTGGR